jgi:hypothetical protein
MRTLHDDGFYAALLHDDGVVELRRSAEPWRDLEDAHARTEAVVRAIRGALPSGRGEAMVMDFREARSRNDEGFENMMAEYRDAMRESFDRVAVLARTAIGRMQIDRLNRGHDKAPAIFDERDEALRWLRS